MKTALICIFYNITDTQRASYASCCSSCRQSVKRFPSIWLTPTIYCKYLILRYWLFTSYLLFSSLLPPRRDIIDSYEKKNIYSCQSYEWDRITFVDYAAPLHGAANSWVMLFRWESGRKGEIEIVDSASGSRGFRMKVAASTQKKIARTNCRSGMKGGVSLS